MDYMEATDNLQKNKIDVYFTPKRERNSTWIQMQTLRKIEVLLLLGENRSSQKDLPTFPALLPGSFFLAYLSVICFPYKSQNDDFLKKNFIVIQLQLYAFSPHSSTPPQLNPPPFRTDHLHTSSVK